MDPLTQRLVDGARAGETVDVAGDVPADLLLRVLRGQTEERIHPRGLSLRRARLVGPVDWEWQNLTAPLELVDCDVEAPINVDHGAVAGLSFRDCRLHSFSGENLTSLSHLRFNDCDLQGSVKLRGASIRGSLIATGATFRAGDDGVALAAARLSVEAGVVLDRGFTALGQVMLRAARVGSTMYLAGGRFISLTHEAIFADNIVVGGAVLMRDGFSATGEVRFRGAQIGANLECSDGSFDAAGSDFALWLSGSRIGGNAWLDDGFSSSGQVRLVGVSIGGTLACQEARFSNPGDVAFRGAQLDVHGNVDFATSSDRPAVQIEGELSLLGAQIRGSLLLDRVQVTNAGAVTIDARDLRVARNLRMGRGFRSVGKIRAGGARVGGFLGCDRSTFCNPGGVALDLVNAEISDSALLRPDCVVEGELNLQRTRFGSALDLTGVSISNPGGRALMGQSAQVAGSAWLQGSVIEGSVHLDSAQIGGDLSLTGSSLVGTSYPDGVLAFDGEGLAVAGSLRWRDMTAGPQGRVDLSRASVAELDDDPAGWPGQGLLELAGFSYGRLSDRAPRAPAERIAWVRLQPGFAPEPYQQLAEVYRKSGQVAEATTVAMAQQDDLVARGELTRPARLWKRFLGLTIGHGYRPGRAAWLLLALYLITAGTVWIGAANNAFIQVGDTAPQPAVTSSRCADDYPCFSVEAYALENITPFINLHQSENWHPKSSTPWELALRDWLYLCTVAGYAGTTLLAAGLSGLARNT